MKELILGLALLFAADAMANIDYVAGDDKEPTDEEVSNSRGCFDELEKRGCGDPGENIRAFRSCLHDVFPSLTDSCRKLMTELYRRRD